MMNIRMGAFVITVCLLQFACSTPDKVRAPRSMLEMNPIDKIALYVGGKATLTNPIIQLLSVSKSKVLLYKALENVRLALNNRGYTVVEAEPVAIGFYSRGYRLIRGDEKKVDISGFTRHVIDSDKLDLLNEYERIATNEPVHRYQIPNAKPEKTEALEHLFSDLNESIGKKQHLSFAPDRQDVHNVAKNTEADTICLLRVYGSTKKVLEEVGVYGTVFDGMAPSGICEYLFVFIDSKTGDVLWQYALFAYAEPLDPDISFIEDALKFFPEKGRPMLGTLTEDGMIKCE